MRRLFTAISKLIALLNSILLAFTLDAPDIAAIGYLSEQETDDEYNDEE